MVRAEASASDPYAALDVAMTKLMERLRRAHDRRKAKSARRDAKALPAVDPSTLPPPEDTAAEESAPSRIVAPTEPDVAVESQAVTPRCSCGRRSTGRPR